MEVALSRLYCSWSWIVLGDVERETDIGRTDIWMGGKSPVRGPIEWTFRGECLDCSGDGVDGLGLDPEGSVFTSFL